MSTRTPPPGPLPGPFSGPPTLTVRTPEDVVALVPVVLGFHPAESVALLTFGAPAGSFHARVDLPRSSEGVAEVAQVLARAVSANGARIAMVVVCGEDHAACVAAAEAVVPALRVAGADVVEALRIHDACWWPLLDGACSGPTAYDVSAHPFTVHHVLSGQVVRPDRAAVAQALVGRDARDTRRLARAVAEVRAQRRDPRIEAAWLRDWVADRGARPRDRPSAPVPDVEAARVLALVNDGGQREVACLDLTREVAHTLCETWVELVRRAPDDLVAGPAGMLALVAWLAGDGALAWCAVDRALEQDPADAVARAVAEALQAAVPPTSWTPPDPARTLLPHRAS